MIKAIFFDVDGTLISHTDGTIPESTRLALKKLSEKGIQRVLATGRHTSELAVLPINDIPFDGYILLNGQLCLDRQKQVIWQNPITGKEKDFLIRLFIEKTIPLVLVEKDRLYINFINRQVEIAQQAISTPLPDIQSYTGNDIYLAVGYADLHTQKALLSQLTGCQITRWHDYAVDIITASGGKTVGIKEYLKANGIAQEETMAFGDGENDMDMLRFVQTGVAMGNADDVVKSRSDYVTDRVDQDGIMHALKALHILD